MNNHVTTQARLSEAEAAQQLGVSRSGLAQFARQNRGPVFYQIGRERQYDPADLKAWLAEQRRSDTSALAQITGLAQSWIDDYEDNEYPVAQAAVPATRAECGRAIIDLIGSVS